MVRADFITSILLILLGLGALDESLGMPRFEHLQVNPYTVPGIVPGILSVVLILLGGILLIRSTMRGGWRLRAGTSLAALTGAANQRLAMTLVLTIGYAAGLVGRIPYWLATAVFVFLFIALFEWRRGRGARGHARAGALALVLAVMVAIAVTAIFQLLFLVRLP